MIWQISWKRCRHENPTSAARNILISDNVPAGVSVVDGSISDGGVLTDGKMTPSAAYRIELFSGYITTMDSSAYMQNFDSIREHTDWLKEVSGRSDFRANLEISAYDRVITLSTCAYRFENARYVLHGKLVELR